MGPLHPSPQPSPHIFHVGRGSFELNFRYLIRELIGCAVRIKLLRSCPIYDITWAQLNSPHVALLSREVEGPALRYLGNQPKQYGANSGR